MFSFSLKSKSFRPPKVELDNLTDTFLRPKSNTFLYVTQKFSLLWREKTEFLGYIQRKKADLRIKTLQYLFQNDLRNKMAYDLYCIGMHISVPIKLNLSLNAYFWEYNWLTFDLSTFASKKFNFGLKAELICQFSFYALYLGALAWFVARQVSTYLLTYIFYDHN